LKTGLFGGVSEKSGFFMGAFPVEKPGQYRLIGGKLFIGTV